MRLAVALGLLIVVTVGCTLLPNASVAPPATQTEQPFRYSADNMWAFLASTPGLQDRASTLEEATQFAELVIIGSFESLERGAGYAAPGEDPTWTAEAVLRVDQVLAGEPSADGIVIAPFVLVAGGDAYPDKEFEDISASMPSGPAVVWLYSWQQYFERVGYDVPDWLKAADRTDRYKLIGGDGFMRIEDDRVVAPGYATGWPAELSGTALAVLEGLVAAAAE